MLIILINKLLPPYDKKGKVTPVTGINPITTERLSIAWTMIWKTRPKDKYLLNELDELITILNPKYKNNRNKETTIITPRTPNSSLIIENIKSVCGSGK